MKNLITLILFIAFSCSVTGSVYGQKQLKTTNATFTTTDLKHNFDIPIKEDGSYSCRLLDPHGIVISVPINNSQFTAGQRAKFSLNSKYWEAGSYSVIIEKDGRFQDRYEINISDGKAEKEMLRRQQQVKAKKNN